VERLTPEAGGKQKVFRDTVVTNFNDFFETFNARNMLNDAELEAMVTQAKEVLSGVKDMKSLRDDAKLREGLVAKFAEVNTVMDTLIADAPSRRFDFSE
jgi:Flp pilus assembly CpaF family ATPase